jgi:UDP-N-acetylmuramoylalanine--D-glutamate ligase
VVLTDVSVLPDDLLLTVPGQHNRTNAASAYEALKAIDLNDEEIFAALATFRGVPGRLQYVGATELGLRVYNDNNSTTPAATLAALVAVAAGKNVILIAGGSYKAVDPEPLLSGLVSYVKQLLLLPGTGTDRLVSLLAADTIPVNWNSVSTIAEAVAAGLALGESGDVLLFSPAFASFGQFKNEYERNDVFMGEIAKHLV